MEKLGHNDDKQIRSLGDFIVPSTNEIILYFLISFIFIFLINIPVLWELLNDYSGLSVAESTLDISTQFNNFYDNYFASEFLAKVAVFVFWGIIGSVTYMLVWAIWHFYLRLKEDVEDSKSSKVNRNKFWQTRLSMHILVFFSTVSGILYFSIAFYLYPSIFALSKLTLYNLSDITYLQYIFFAFLISTVYIYVFSRLWNAIRYVYAIYFSGLDD